MLNFKQLSIILTLKETIHNIHLNPNHQQACKVQEIHTNQVAYNFILIIPYVNFCMNLKSCQKKGILSQNKLYFRGFKCTQIFQNQLYLVRLTTIDKIRKLFLCEQPLKYILCIKTHQFRSVRTVTLKPLNKSNKVNNLPNFKQQKQVQQLLSYLSSSQKLNKPLTNQQMNQLDSEYKQDVYSLDATSNYMFSKMLVDKNYSIGKRIQVIISHFKQKQKIKQKKFSQLIWLNYAINQITDQMLEGFNCSRKQLYQILGYCRKSIQNYFYTSIQQYKAQNNIRSMKQIEQVKQNAQFLLNQSRISQKSLQKSTKNISDYDLTYSTSMKYLKKLLKSQISIQIFKNFFLLIQFIKIQTVINKISQDDKIQLLNWLKQNYFMILLEKIKNLRAAGFSDVHFENFLRELKLQE